MAAAKNLLFEVKSKQYLLIARAGMSVPTIEMGIEQIQDKMLEQFHLYVGKWNPPANLKHIPKTRFFRTNKQLADHAAKSDEHTGMTLWRKYAEIKKYIVNQITPIYAKQMGKDGHLPSGISREEVLLVTREKLFAAEQKLAALKSRSQKGYVPKTWFPSWYPHEWEVFLLYGKGSANPDNAFNAE